jgi:hypothetical protein
VRGGWVAWLLVVWLVGLFVPSTALAASEVEIRHAADGTLVVVGSGWRHGALQVSLGADRFTAYADATGDFEVETGLASYSGDLAVHHLTLVHVEPMALSPSPLGALLAQTVAQGCALLAVAATTALLIRKIARRR